jgi:predicted dehydrogenase
MNVKNVLLATAITMSLTISGCEQKPEATGFTGAAGEVKLITVAPGHFHAYLVQKSMYDQVDPVVHVYAPEGNEVDAHLAMIDTYNSRPDNPTSWQQVVYRGNDYLDKMIAEKKGNLVILAGNNSKKTQYIHKAVGAGLNVLSDKPMAINATNFELLKSAFDVAKQNNVLLYDIMTERYAITSILQKELMHIPDIFGVLEKGSLENPSIVKESVHHLFKYVSGSVLRRPPWFFDVAQQGEGIIDVTTHLVDLIQWACFPEEILDYQSDVNMLSASRWPTPVSFTEFESITREPEFPAYLKANVVQDSILEVFVNGEMNYTLKGIHARVIVKWDYRAPEGTGDTHYSIARGSKTNLVIRQGAAENFKPVLYIEPVDASNGETSTDEINAAFAAVSEKYPGVSIEPSENGWKVVVPSIYDVGHEAHFAQVTEKYLQFLIDGKLPDWEVPNMLAKYYTTTRALEMAITGR